MKFILFLIYVVVTFEVIHTEQRSLGEENLDVDSGNNVRKKRGGDVFGFVPFAGGNRNGDQQRRGDAGTPQDAADRGMTVAEHGAGIAQQAAARGMSIAEHGSGTAHQAPDRGTGGAQQNRNSFF